MFSVVVPCYNEEEVLLQTHAELASTLAETSHEIIYINDGSSDNTLGILAQLAANSPCVRVLSFSRNFGHQVAVTAGIDHATGDHIGLIDADLQDPPEILLSMRQQLTDHVDVVYGQRISREGESAFKLITAQVFYRILNKLSSVPIPLDTGDFRVMTRRAADCLKQMPERDRFIRGMVSWIGFRQVPFPYERKKRQAGHSKYPLRKMLTFALDGILSFSIKPLRIATWIGLISAGLAIAGILYAVVMRLATDVWVPGWTLLIIAVLFLGGAQLFCLGLIGEYVGRIYNESKKRPSYIIADRLGWPQQGQNVGP